MIQCNVMASKEKNIRGKEIFDIGELFFSVFVKDPNHYLEKILYSYYFGDATIMYLKKNHSQHNYTKEGYFKTIININGTGKDNKSRNGSCKISFQIKGNLK